MKVQFSTCAQSVSVDHLTSRLSIFNVLDQITVPGFPIFIPEVTYVALIRREDEEPSQQFKCSLTVTQNSNPGAVGEALIQFAGSEVARLIVNFSGLAIHSSGDIDFNLMLPGGAAHKLTIPVRQVG